MFEGSSVMWRYIAEEPDILRKIMSENEYAFDDFLETKSYKAVYLVAHGSSYNAAVVISSFFAQQTGLRVQAITPAEFVWWPSSWQQEPTGNALVIAISQTGTSGGVLQAVVCAKNAGCKVVAITNEHSSPLDLLADKTLLLGCGIEESNAKTKGYSATLLLLLLLSLHIGKETKMLTTATCAQIRNEISKQIEALNSVSERIQLWCEENYFYKDCSHLVFLGGNMNYGTALEGQLKLIETLGVPAMACNIQEFSHGIHRSIKPSTHVVMFAAEPNLWDLTLSTFQYLQTITPNIVLFNATNQILDDPKVIQLPHFSRTQAILLQTLAVQVLGVLLPERNGLDPNRPANDDYVTIARTRVQKK